MATVSVTTTATLLSGTGADSASGGAVAIYNAGAQTVYLETTTAATTAADGFPLDPNQTATINLPGDQKLYGIVASGTANVKRLRVG